MEVELFGNALSEEDTVEVDADNDNLGAEGERCGICMDVVIDRGVLDCCQHWFCFVCIDNWATITNLCPLCQNEFQLITCVPVYDTIGSSKNDEDSDSRDDDWCVEGTKNSLSFPSYYIDENAVACLDGDGCKIRSGSMTYEETLTLDTSIACDSCDTWYHAFCVGFDPEGTGVDSWICPRCLVNEADQKSELKDMYCTGNNADHHRLVDTSSGKVSVSVADTGETAVVVSRFDGEDVRNEPTMNRMSIQDITDHCKLEQSILDPECHSSEMKKPLDQGINIFRPESIVPSAKFGETVVKVEPDGSETRMSLDLGLSFSSNLSDDKADNLSARDDCLRDASADESPKDTKPDISPNLGEKRKRIGQSALKNSFRTSEDNGRHDGRLMGASSSKKPKVQRRTKSTTLNVQEAVCAPEDVCKNSILIEKSADEIDGNIIAKKNQPIDIMSIVQGTELRRVNGPVRQKEAGKFAKVEKNAAGLRVKKIVRRDKGSDAEVQKLRKEIREAVRKKPSGDFDKSIFDPNLLAAFRAAVAGPVAEPSKKASSAIVKAKKLMLQKGKARENLTKKIYATSSGKRRRAWDRDCEIEFWKHRCLTTARPEKIETLRSVLNLLKWNPDTKVVEQTSEEEKAPLLSRLYLADASLFPRKDDIKPLSVLKAAEQNDALSSGEKCIDSHPDNCTVKPLDTIKDPSQSNIASVGDKKKGVCASIKNGIASGKSSFGGNSDKASPHKKSNGKIDDIKVDKRKWALEVLARKTSSGATPMHQKQDNTVLKGNYPLLAELPTDMRPKPEPTRQNKVPVSVRQVQLYRLTEHLLKMTNLSSMHRTAATELAIADAINIEKQVADRSNSKVVYLNLCSQEIRNRTICSSSGSPAEAIPSDPVPVPSEGDQPSTASLNSEAEAALQAAGLLSDSPPSSPLHKFEYRNGDDNSVGQEKEEIESIFEMDCHPDLDIYGDFEYDLDEEDYIGATAINASNAQAEEGESKVKVVFSTLNSVRSDNSPDALEQNLPKTDALSSLSSLLTCPKLDGSGSSPIKDKVRCASLPGDAFLDGEGEELSVVECEMLYGPDGELSPKNNFDLVLAENSAVQSTNICNADENKVTTDSLQIVGVGENPSGSSEPNRKTKAEEEKNSDPKADKKSEHAESVLRKVETYIKEHIRPLCKSGVITVEQYRWAVGKTTEKVMKYHSKSKNANFLIKEGEKVKKLAEQYVETAKHKENK